MDVFYSGGALDGDAGADPQLCQFIAQCCCRVAYNETTIWDSIRLV